VFDRWCVSALGLGARVHIITVKVRGNATVLAGNLVYLNTPSCTSARSIFIPSCSPAPYIYRDIPYIYIHVYIYVCQCVCVWCGVWACVAPMRCGSYRLVGALARMRVLCSRGRSLTVAARHHRQGSSCDVVCAFFCLCLSVCVCMLHYWVLPYSSWCFAAFGSP